MAEPVTIVKYKSLNGQMYDNEKAANRADAAWQKENVFDCVKEVANYQQTGERIVARSTTRWMADSSQFPKLLIERSKHGDAYHLIKSPNEYADAYYSIFENYQAGGWYEYTTKDSSVAEEILRTKNKTAAIAFVQDHNQEYASVDIETMYQYS